MVVASPSSPTTAPPLRIPSVVFVEVVRLLTVVLCTAAGWELAGGNSATDGTALLGAVLGACVGYLQGGLVGRALRRALVNFEERVDRTPAVALVLGAVLGWLAAYIIYKNTDSQLGASLLYMAVFGAVISYFMQCVSFIMLRRRLPNIARPYRSPVGEWGAAIAGVIALCALGAILYNEDYRPGVYGVLAVYLVALAYFAAAGRHRLVLSPEEEFATTLGERGHPETEGYGRTSVEDAGATAGTSPAPEPPASRHV